jgi:hypothetical protein
MSFRPKKNELEHLKRDSKDIGQFGNSGRAYFPEGMANEGSLRLLMSPQKIEKPMVS